MRDRNDYYHEIPSNPSISFGKYTTLNGRTVDLRTTSRTDTIALVWDDGGVDMFEVTAVEVFIDLFIRAVAAAKDEPVDQDRIGTFGEESARLLELRAMMKKQRARVRAARKQQ